MLNERSAEYKEGNFRFGEPWFERAVIALSWFQTCSIVVTVAALIVCVIINAIN